MRLARLIPSCLLAALPALAVAAPVSAQLECWPSPVPDELPPVDAIADSSAIAALIAGSGMEGVVRFSIVADVYEEPRAYPAGALAGGRATEWLTSRIDDLLRPAPRRSTAWGVRLVAIADSMPQLSLERSEYCPPARKPDPLPRMIAVTRRAGSPSPEFPVYAVRISASGDVRGVTFIRGDRDFHSQIRGVAMGMRYHPARIDGVAVVSADTIGRP